MKVGDYIEIRPGVHDQKMPLKRRDGLIVALLGQSGWDRVPDQVLVMFSNGAFLTFHKSQIEVIKKLPTPKEESFP